MSDDIIKVSPLRKTWILDLDGTIVKHNGYKIDGHDTLLPGAEEFLNNISPDDMVVFITSRGKDIMADTVNFLRAKHIRYDHIIWNAPYGERILINDRKPSGLEMAVAVNTWRDVAIDVRFVSDPSL